MNNEPQNKGPLPGYLRVLSEIRARDWGKRGRNYMEGIWLATHVIGLYAAWLTADEVLSLTGVDVKHQAEVEKILRANRALLIEGERGDRGKLFRILHYNEWKVTIKRSDEVLRSTLRAIAHANGRQQDRTPFDEEFSEAMADAGASEGRMPDADQWWQQMQAAANGDTAPIVSVPHRDGGRPGPQIGDERPNSKPSPHFGESHKSIVDTGFHGHPPPNSAPQVPKLGTGGTLDVVRFPNGNDKTSNVPLRRPSFGDWRKPKEVLAEFLRLAPDCPVEEKIRVLISQWQWDKYDIQWLEIIQEDKANVEKAIRMVVGGLKDGLKWKKTAAQWLWFEYKKIREKAMEAAEKAAQKAQQS